MSSRDEPPRKVQRLVRSAGRIGWLQSSVRFGADVPSPRPARPWQEAQPMRVKTSLPFSAEAAENAGAFGIAIGVPAFDGSAKSGEKLFTAARSSCRSLSGRWLQ